MHRLLMGSAGVVLMLGCQGKAAQDEPSQTQSSQESSEEEAVVEETFDSGDTGELSSVSVEETEAEEEPQGDSE